ncbi:hypothetical protein B0J14DRAFT_646612 [Halenospora varia]|nr:hypothetical protein B0J14DRAFT_646612 [Halenospora varia]
MQAQAYQDVVSRLQEEGKSIKEKKYKLLGGLGTIFAGILLPVIIGLVTVPALLVAAMANEQSQTATNSLFYHSVPEMCFDSAAQLCQDLIAQVESFLPSIANVLYGIATESGGWQVLASASPVKNTTSISLQASIWGTSTSLCQRNNSNSDKFNSGISEGSAAG